MTKKSIDIAVPLDISRHIPPPQLAEVAKALEASAVVDDVLIYDQLGGWLPPSLWTRENTSLVDVIADTDSFPDPFAMAAYVSAATPDLGVVISSDGSRRGPAELMQTMLTLSDMTGGRAAVQLGAGELKQFKPFGWKRKEGLGRLEDQFKAAKLFRDNEGPVDLAGNYWTLANAWLGNARRHRPQVWGLGGGPKLIDLTTSYADGFATIAPCVWNTPELVAEQIASLKTDLEHKDRDPEEFGFGIWAALMVHEDQSEIERSLQNPLTRFLAAICGRINQADWLKEGIEPVFPADWHYATKLLPLALSPQEVDEIVRKVTPEMAAKSFITGTPSEVSAILQAFVDAGATWIALVDCMSVTQPPEATRAAFARSIEISRTLKAGASAAALA